MPLPFYSLSHGPIAFGFFNIETDLLLLEQYFFFAHFFCNRVEQLASFKGRKMEQTILPGYVIKKWGDVGSLMGAIHGIDLSGFMGAVYKLFPFPQSQEGFKQQPDGSKNRGVIEKILHKWSQPTTILLEVQYKSRDVKIAELLFSKTIFHDLVAYVWGGGMPGWRDSIRPDYVVAMKNAINKSTLPLFKNFEL